MEQPMNMNMNMNINIDFIKNQDKLQKVLTILKSLDKKFIIVDGVISAGKTTLIKLIETKVNSNPDNIKIKKINIKAIFEPVDLWTSTGALSYFYDNILK